MPPPPRTDANHRAYDDTHVARLRFVMRARDLGFSLDEIRELLALFDGKAGSCADVRELALRHVASVRARVRDLERIAAVLSDTVSRCSGEAVPECAVIDALQGAD